MVVFAGESLIDMVSDGRGSYTPHVGGSVLNSSIALGRLTGKSYYMGGVSYDQYGAMIKDYLDDSNVKQKFLVKVDRPTTLAYVDLDEKGVAKYRFEDDVSAGRLIDQQSLQPFVDSVKQANAVLFGGISLQSEPCGTAWHWLVDQIHQDTVIFYDPNIRPKFIDSKSAYIERFHDIVSKSNIVKISEEDADYLFGAQSFGKQMQDWFDSGVDMVLHTLGEKGVRATLSNGKMIEVTVDPVEVVDTIAAGDSFNAGLLYFLDQAKLLNSESLDTISASQLKDALCFANKVARYTVSQKGANPPRLYQVK